MTSAHNPSRTICKANSLQPTCLQGMSALSPRCPPCPVELMLLRALHESNPNLHAWTYQTSQLSNISATQQATRTNQSARAQNCMPHHTCTFPPGQPSGCSDHWGKNIPGMGSPGGKTGPMGIIWPPPIMPSAIMGIMGGIGMPMPIMPGWGDA